MIRFCIRKEPRDDQWCWTLRDGICAESLNHDFNDPNWADTCTGECDISIYFSSAIGKASQAGRKCHK
jgi:hypothetical protein